MMAFNWAMHLNNWSIEILERIEDDIYNNLPEKTKISKWLGYEPASLSQIEEAEEILGIQFQEDDRSFWLTSNGWEGFYPEKFRIFSIAQVKRLTQHNNQLLDAWQAGIDHSIIMDTSNVDKSEPIPVTAEYLSKTIVIGEGDDGQYILYHHDKTDMQLSTFLMFSTWYPGAYFYPSLSLLLSHLIREYNLLEEKRRNIK